MTKKERHNHHNLDDFLYKLRISKDKAEFFRSIDINKQGFVLLRLSKKYKKKILDELKNKEIVTLLHYLDPDKAVDLLHYLDNGRRKRIIKKLKIEAKEKVEFLLKFDPKSAAGLMSLDYIEVNKKHVFKHVSRLIKKHEKQTGKFPAILVVDDGFLIGEVIGHKFALHTGREKVSKHVKRVATVKYNSNQKDVLNMFKKHPHNKIVVLDDDDSILGIIYSDDVLRILHENSTSTLYDFAGVREQEDVLDSFAVKVKNRFGWLVINLGTAFLAAAVVGLFQSTINALVLLAVYMPIVAGMGGNAGTQTSAVMIRGLTLKEVELKTCKRVLFNEILAGIINGILIGIIVALISTVFNKNPMFGLVIGLSMVANLFIAGLFGAIVPLIMKSLGKDPASSASVFVTTATDVCGFFVFLGLASIMLL